MNGKTKRQSKQPAKRLPTRRKIKSVHPKVKLQNGTPSVNTWHHPTYLCPKKLQIKPW
jgi:hypothetical protein